MTTIKKARRARSVRFSDCEWALIEIVSAKSGHKPSQWLRNLAISKIEIATAEKLAEASASK